MKITIAGAAGGEVTGSAYYVQTTQAGVLVDCGLFQGGKKADELNRPPIGPQQRLDAVLLTHAHLDHTGRLPLLVHAGCQAPVFATPATVDLTALILRDSAKIQMVEAERRNRKHPNADNAPVPPLYDAEDAERAIKLLQPVQYQVPVQVAPGIRAVWSEAGHMLGSASIQLLVQEDGREKRVVFSGDLGPKNAPILKDYEPFQQADLVFLESTYGDHDHRPFAETVEEFVAIVQEVVKTKGKILVPTFAVGRAQLLTLLVAGMFRAGKVPPFPVFLDSPMAIEASKIYMHHRELFDEETIRFLGAGVLGEDLRTLKMSVTADDSKAINAVPGPFMVMAGAGMCNAGRILHHFRQHLGKPDTHVLIVGYQATGSIGRMLVEGEKLLSIHGEKVEVKGQIHTLGGFSAHAGQSDLLAWFHAIAPAKPRVVLTHGETGPRAALAKLIQERYSLPPKLPELMESVEV